MKGQDCWACARGPRGGPPGAELRPRTGHAAPRPAWSPEGLPGAAPSSSEETGAAPRSPRGLRVRTGVSRRSDLLRLSGLSARPGVGGVRSRVGIQQSLLSQPARTATFQQRFDARQKIGLSDARLKLGVKDAREKLLQKDARFRIKGKVQDAREMLNSRKQQSTAPQKPHQVADAREKISLKRNSPAAFMSPPIGTVTPALKLTKTIQVPQQKAMAPIHAHPAGMRINVVNNHQAKQNLYDLDDDDDVIAPIPTKQMKFAASGSFLHHMPVLSPLEGTKMTVNNLHPRVTEEDIVELFCVCGALKRARLVHPGVAEVVFVKKDDAITAYKKYNNRCLDGQPMKCNLHMNGNVITSDQPILLRLSDSPSVKKESELPRRVNSATSSNPPAEVDPDTILKALFKSSGASVTTQPTEFKIKL
ncbi:polymerase delta-interacting protein 3 isoform X4 [Ovis aries]|uniref:polymerase delta-interacting protein 3 isoform X4 n=1 Tax=Ovis aries TaxID=9940 RepID=UPI001C2EE0D2|nr:polymerase delta-interacting protein 3 isoform X4 [Ovis aries]